MTTSENTEMASIERNWGAEEWRAPELSEGDELLACECGRIVHGVGTSGAVDCRSHWFRLVRRHRNIYLLVKHGGGTERFEIKYGFMVPIAAIVTIPSDELYMMLATLYHAYQSGVANGLATAAKRTEAEIAAGTLKRHRPRKARIEARS